MHSTYRTLILIIHLTPRYRTLNPDQLMSKFLTVPIFVITYNRYNWQVILYWVYRALKGFTLRGEVSWRCSRLVLNYHTAEQGGPCAPE